MTREERSEESFDRMLAEWIDDGTSHAPPRVLAHASAHARAHPRRTVSRVGLWRVVMDRIQLSDVEAQPRQRGWLAAVGVAIAIGVVAIGIIGTGALRFGGGPEEPAAVGGAPVATATPASSSPLAPAPTGQVVTPTPSPSLWAAGKAAAVTGTIDCSRVMTPGVDQRTVAPFRLSGQVNDCIAIASDPRVTGSGSLVLNVEGWDPALPTQGTNGVLWSYEEIQGPDGTWAGRTYGLYDKDGLLHNYGVLAGDGAYKGLIYVVYGIVPASSGRATIVGVIQPGTPPPGFLVTPFSTP